MKPDYVYGLHAVTSLLEKRADSIIALWVAVDRHDKRINQLLQLAKQVHVKIHKATRQELDKRLPDLRHQGVIAEIKAQSQLQEADLQDFVSELEQPFILILDGVQDPHNLGACLRTADAAGVDVVIAPKNRSASITPVARKVASGAAEALPFVQVTNLARTLRLLKDLGVWVIGAAGEADLNVFEADLKGPLAMVVGNEGDGMRRLTKEHCDLLVKIPMRGIVSSLNVSVATGVLLFAAHKD